MFETIANCRRAIVLVSEIILELVSCKSLTTIFPSLTVANIPSLFICISYIHSMAQVSTIAKDLKNTLHYKEL